MHELCFLKKFTKSSNVRLLECKPISEGIDPPDDKGSLVKFFVPIKKVGTVAVCCTCVL
jgi:hypothetical protein